MRHIDVNQLWIQEKVRSGEISIIKVHGKDNIADALTKYCDNQSLETHMTGAGLIRKEGRHSLMPRVEGRMEEGTENQGENEDEEEEEPNQNCAEEIMCLCMGKLGR